VSPGLLDPGPAAAAGAPHGQLASGLPGGGLALSGHKLVEDAVRATILLAPGLFRLDVRPVEDTLQVMTRTLHALPGHWVIVSDPEAGGGAGVAEPYRLAWRFELALEPRPLRGQVALAMTTDWQRGVAHFVGQAVLREVSA
jgi:hypothetical protein